MQLKIAEEAEASRIVAKLKAERAARHLWWWSGLGCLHSIVIILIYRHQIDLALMWFAAMASLMPVCLGLWLHQQAITKMVAHHNRGLQIQNNILNAQLDTARRAQCPDPKCPRCRAVLVQRRADFVMEQYGRLSPFRKETGCDDQ